MRASKPKCVQSTYGGSSQLCTATLHRASAHMSDALPLPEADAASLAAEAGGDGVDEL